VRQALMIGNSDGIGLAAVNTQSYWTTCYWNARLIFASTSRGSANRWISLSCLEGWLFKLPRGLGVGCETQRRLCNERTIWIRGASQVDDEVGGEMTVLCILEGWLSVPLTRRSVN
jgi:hypothetical protein